MKIKIKKQNKTETIRIRVSLNQKKEIERLLNKLGVESFSHFARWAIIDSLRAEIAGEEGKAYFGIPYKQSL